MSTFGDMVSFMDTFWHARDEIVPCLMGPPGIGKTVAVRQHAENVKAGKVVTIIASQILPNEVSGITMPVPERHAMEIYDHYRLSSLEDGDILFFDELLEADDMVLSACLTLIESRMLMSGEMLPDIQIVAATNETKKPQQIRPSIRNRFLYQSFNIDKDSTREHIKNVCGFDPGNLVDLLEEDSNSYNVLTPRTLTKLAKAIATADDDVAMSEVAQQIDRCWRNELGSKLLIAALGNDDIEVLRQHLVSIVMENTTEVPAELLAILSNHKSFKDKPLSETMDMITELPSWEKIKVALEMTSIYSQKTIDF